MPVLRARSSTMSPVREAVSRRLIHADNLMMVVIDFTNGPWAHPEPMHHHFHEQATYVAEGEILFFCEGEKEEKLSAGDMFWIPSDKKHGIQLLSKQAKLIDSFSPVREDFI